MNVFLADRMKNCFRLPFTILRPSSPFFTGRNFGDFPKRDSESDLPKESKWNPKCVGLSSRIIDYKEARLQKKYIKDTVGFYNGRIVATAR